MQDARIPSDIASHFDSTNRDQSAGASQASEDNVAWWVRFHNEHHRAGTVAPSIPDPPYNAVRTSQRQAIPTTSSAARLHSSSHAAETADLQQVEVRRKRQWSK